ncbi:MAG: restriction endonuclease subunit S, partial [Thermoguttaceae bacterium]|nr:restriction endonuclease subunit S [Thermoguttaceae bacterium]
MNAIEKMVAELCPEGVELFKLSEIAHYSKTRVDASTLNENNYVGVENLLQNKRGKTKASSIPSIRVAGFQKGDVLIGNIRPYLRKIWLADIDGGASGDVLTICINNRNLVFPQYLYTILASEKFFVYNNQRARGGTMPRGDKKAVMRFEIPVPP